ncbi:hypothetical protein BD289DRAFT_479862 [Coniella lustricola]|uniref:Uncharacterized protein n=1 Tax=Coniella lustricola TaxID=2025994 RepID=A0A2T3AHL6_9PEZI|nr:hypothetical protein BD289DRAFT_479862 [Coniella lustricola]
MPATIGLSFVGILSTGPHVIPIRSIVPYITKRYPDAPSTVPSSTLTHMQVFPIEQACMKDSASENTNTAMATVSSVTATSDASAAAEEYRPQYYYRRYEPCSMEVFFLIIFNYLPAFLFTVMRETVILAFWGVAAVLYLAFFTGLKLFIFSCMALSSFADWVSRMIVGVIRFGVGVVVDAVEGVRGIGKAIGSLFL